MKNPPAMQEMWQEPWIQSLGQEDPWRRKWQLSPVSLLEKSRGQERLVGYSPWGCRRVRHDLTTKQQYSELNRKLRSLSIDDIQICGVRLSWE